MADGYYAYIDGTTYDAVNSMNYGFVVDIAVVSGSGSKSYSYAGFTLTAFLVGGAVIQGTAQKSGTVTISGQTVSWSGVEGTVPKLVVYATANATLKYDGFVYNDYTKNPPVMKLAPPFTPLALTQVIDLTPGYGQVLQTSVPYGAAFIAFHRSTASSGFDHVMWDEINQNGFWSLRFRPAIDGSIAMGPCRIYVFSKTLVNIPSAGFFMYLDGQIVWHNNCLPLEMRVGGKSGQSTPVAITAGASVLVNIPWDPTYPIQGQSRYNCYSAGINSQGLFEASGADLYAAREYKSVGNAPPGSSMGPPASINTSVYDTYYRQALGV
ncbi:hypothetical protein F3J38_25205 [Pantoea sp. Acro-805]|uniref:Phage protein n=1 Tax=Candidatus Pantoea formicae TaxID=2608355 RepID=A0ABX0R849_9GAMM|nr:hypothetical protein [Pantoea formicae]NIF03307.1 hypothetical protein [Pantoea formicae]